MITRLTEDMSRKKGSLFCLCLLLGYMAFLVAFPTPARADIGQSDYSTLSPHVISVGNTPAGVAIVLPLGNGIAGTATSIDLKLNNTQSTSAQVQIFLSAYTDSAYSIPAGGAWNGGFDCGVNNSSATIASGDSAPSFSMSYHCGTAFNPALYYTATFNLTNLSNPQGIKIYGSTTALPKGCITAGACSYPSDFNGDGSFNAPYFSIHGLTGGNYPVAPPDTSTHIVSFFPNDGATTTSPVTFTLHAYINPDDLSFLQGLKITYSYHSQNSFLAADQYLLDSVVATTSGDFYYTSSPITLAGNYISDVFIQTSYLGGIFVNPWGSNVTQKYAQWVVGSSTVIGQQYQQTVGQTQDVINAYTGTSTSANLNACNPFADFNVPVCLFNLIIPSASSTQVAFSNIYNQVLVKWPFGYITRVATIFATTTQSALPAITATIPPGVYGAGQTISIDPFAAFASTSVLNTATTTDTNQNLRQIAEPYWDNAVMMLFAVLVFASFL